VCRERGGHSGTGSVAGGMAQDTWCTGWHVLSRGQRRVQDRLQPTRTTVITRRNGASNSVAASHENVDPSVVTRPARVESVESWAGCGWLVVGGGLVVGGRLVVGGGLLVLS
jgi:hypothetical protein